MKNYIVSIFNKTSNEKLAEYTVEEETSTIAGLIARGRYRKDYPKESHIDIKYSSKETSRKIIPIQEPKKWKFI